MLPLIPESWRASLEAETQQEYFRALDQFLDAEIVAGHAVLPARDDIFAALRLTAPAGVRVFLLGQDPYPNPGHAHGLCFSVRPGVRPMPGSLRNIFKELHADVGFRIPNHGHLESWARQGVLLLNTVLTVRAGVPLSHRKRGWERFTDRVIESVNAGPTPVVFVLWGAEAQKKEKLITAPQHAIVKCAHPSPLSARFFLGCRCFSQINRELTARGRPPVDWQLADLPL